MEEHSAIGQRILSNVEDYSEIAIIVRHHHERWDGAGYPDRLAGGEGRAGRHEDDEDSVGELGAGPAARPAPLQRADQPAHPDHGVKRVRRLAERTSITPASRTVASASRQSWGTKNTVREA